MFNLDKQPSRISSKKLFQLISEKISDKKNLFIDKWINDLKLMIIDPFLLLVKIAFMRQPVTASFTNLKNLLIKNPIDKILFIVYDLL